MTDAEKKAAAKKAAAEKKAKAAAEKKVAAKKAAAEKRAAAEKKALAKCKYVGKELKIELSCGAKFTGLCTCERKINGGEQVFVKIKGQGRPSRFFNVEDIVK